MNPQNESNSSKQNYSKKDLIKGLYKTKYTSDEKKKIFLSDNGRKCQTCHKLKINKKLSPFGFSAKHQEFICFCHTQPRRGSSSENNNEVINNNLQNNDNNNNIEANQNNLQNINEDDINMYDGEEMEENPLEPRQQENSRENESNRNVGNAGSNHRNNSRRGGQDDHGNHGGSGDQGGDGGNEGQGDDEGNGGQGGDGGNGGQAGDGGNGGQAGDDGNNYVTKKEFLEEIEKINTSLDEINNTIRQLLHG